MKKPTLRTAIYRRESWWHRDHSVSAQLMVIRRYARKHGLKIVRVATDGKS